MTSDRVLGLVKLGEHRHMEDLLSGRLFMNTLTHFAKIEGSHARRDSREGQAFWWKGDGAVLQMETDGQFRDMCNLSGPIAYSHPEDLKVNVFCMHAVRFAGRAEMIDPRNLVFGDTFVLLKDGDEFLRRVRAAAKAKGLDISWAVVEYVDPQSYQGHVGPFRKSSEFAYQSEFRIALLPGTGVRYVLDVGDLKDIAVMGPLADLNKLLRIE